MPALTIRSYERGTRRLPEQIADRIFYATFISPEWLLDDDASVDNPRGFGGGEYTLDFYRNSGLKDGMLVDVDGNFRLALVYMGLSNAVARLLRVALRKSKHLLCDHLLRKTISTLTKELRLEDSFNKEMPSALQDDQTRTMMMGGGYIPPGDVNMDTYNAALVLSTATLFEWSAALEGTEADRTILLTHIDSARALIQQSFEKRKTQTVSQSANASRKRN